MAKNEYVKLWLSYRSYFESYSAAEVGRLVLAMMEYHASGVEPEFSGSERFVWPAIRRDIDSSLETLETARENGKKGGRPKRVENPKKPNETQNNQGEGEGEGKGEGISPPISPSQGEKADKPPRAARFTPPSLEEVKAYCQERGNKVDPDRFLDFYASKGWMVGKNRMKDWRAAVRNWERGGKENGQVKRDSETVEYGTVF